MRIYRILLTLCIFILPTSVIASGGGGFDFSPQPCRDDTQPPGSILCQYLCFLKFNMCTEAAKDNNEQYEACFDKVNACERGCVEKHCPQPAPYTPPKDPPHEAPPSLL